METDYISREANGDDFVRRADIVEKFMDRLPSISVGYLCKIADEIPPADVRPVVCCRDCGYFKEAKVNSKGFLICPASGMEITDDDFCSYAERGAKMGETP